jgi:hypothetical protein
VHAESTGAETADLRDPEHDWEAAGTVGAGPVNGHTSAGQLLWLTLLIGVAVGPHFGSVEAWVLRCWSVRSSGGSGALALEALYARCVPRLVRSFAVVLPTAGFPA